MDAAVLSAASSSSSSSFEKSNILFFKCPALPMFPGARTYTSRRALFKKKQKQKKQAREREREIEREKQEIYFTFHVSNRERAKNKKRARSRILGPSLPDETMRKQITPPRDATRRCCASVLFNQSKRRLVFSLPAFATAQCVL